MFYYVLHSIPVVVKKESDGNIVRSLDSFRDLFDHVVYYKELHFNDFFSPSSPVSSVSAGGQ